MEPTPNLRTLTVDEISRLTNIPDYKVLDLVKSGFFPRIKMPGRRIYVLEVEVYRALAIQSQPSNSSDTTN
jgi:excisionase family DNA binding protein